MNLFDLFSLIIIFIFSLWGATKGFIVEISEIGGLIISFFLAFYFPLNLRIGTGKYIISFLLYFFTIIFSFSLLSKIIRKTPLLIFDKILGIFTGALKGGLVVITIFLMLSFIPFKAESKLSDSLFYRLSLIVKIPLKNFLKEKIDNFNYKVEPYPKEKGI
ncbi:MAG: CvpA family protein [candidate division WOR-3 bacterium]